MKIDTAGLRRRLYNFGKKTKDKTRKIMERFTVDAENLRRAEYNAQRDAGKVDYLPTRGLMKEQKAIKQDRKRRQQTKVK
jgi:hypothetical protein|tara:strand:- start:55 stop:294 length:240 start_codon:yes stop_codon:yes gene_type:complete